MKKTIYLLLAACIAAVSCQEKAFTDLNVKHEEDNLKTDTLRIISYNILEGMKLDAANNYSDFIEWVKGQDADIFTIQEANGLTEDKLRALAEQWGHPYVVTNCNYPGASTYPVALTSKYEIKDIKHIVDNVYHGGIWANVAGIEVVVLHLYPFGDIKNNVEWDKQKDMDGDGDIDGHDYRIHEMDVYLGETIMKHPLRPNWLMMGDFNAESPLDKDHHAEKKSYGVHERALDIYTDLVQTMHHEFKRSTPTTWGGWTDDRTDGQRIDFIYGSKSLSRDLLRADFIYDNFTESHSDHYPIIVEFRTYEN